MVENKVENKVEQIITSGKLATSNENIYVAAIPNAGHGFDNNGKRKLVVDLTKGCLHATHE